MAGMIERIDEITANGKIKTLAASSKLEKSHSRSKI